MVPEDQRDGDPLGKVRSHLAPRYGRLDLGPGRLWACGESGYSFACDLSNIAVIIGAVVATLHLLAGASVWRGQVRGAVVGAVIALLGLLACLSLLEHEPWWLVLPAFTGYLATLVVLAYVLIAGWRDRRHQA